MGKTQLAKPGNWLMIQGGQVCPSMSQIQIPGPSGLGESVSLGEPRTLCFSHASQGLQCWMEFETYFLVGGGVLTGLSDNLGLPLCAACRPSTV